MNIGWGELHTYNFRVYVEQSNKIIRIVIAKIMYPIFKSKHAHVSFAERPFRNSPNEPVLFKWIFFF